VATRRRRPRGAPRHSFGQAPANARDPLELSYAGKAYLLAARRYGDERTIFETAMDDGQLSAKELGYLASQLRRLDPQRGAKEVVVGEGSRKRIVHEPPFRLTEAEKHLLARRLLAEDVRVKTVAIYCGASVRWVRELRSEAEVERRVAKLLEHGPINLHETNLGRLLDGPKRRSGSALASDPKPVTRPNPDTGSNPPISSVSTSSCEWCNGPLQRGARGPAARFCKSACRVAAHRARAKGAAM
jgi:hypothetical protein